MPFLSFSHFSVVHLLVHAGYYGYNNHILSHHKGEAGSNAWERQRYKKHKDPALLSSHWHLNYEVECVGHQGSSQMHLSKAERMEQDRGREIPLLRSTLALWSLRSKHTDLLAVSRALPSCFRLRAFARTIPSAIMLFTQHTHTTYSLTHFMWSSQ